MALSKTSCIWLLAVLLFLCSSLLLSQPSPVQQRSNFDEMLRRLMLEQLAQPQMRVAERRAADEADKEFTDKFNRHSDAMNQLAEDKRNHVANLKHFELAENTWVKLVEDAGWLRKRK